MKNTFNMIKRSRNDVNGMINSLQQEQNRLYEKQMRLRELEEWQLEYDMRLDMVWQKVEYQQNEGGSYSYKYSSLKATNH